MTEKTEKVNESQIDFLKPCPFCGSHGDDICVDEFWERCAEPYFVTCYRCGANGPYTNKKEKAIELWNKRVNENDCYKVQRNCGGE